MSCSVYFFINNSYWIQYGIIGMNKVIGFWGEFRGGNRGQFNDRSMLIF